LVVVVFGTAAGLNDKEYVEEAFLLPFRTAEEEATGAASAASDEAPDARADRIPVLEIGFGTYILMRQLMDYSDEFATRVVPGGDGGAGGGDEGVVGGGGGGGAGGGARKFVAVEAMRGAAARLVHVSAAPELRGAGCMLFVLCMIGKLLT
jgi:hypothetical protein